MVPLLELTRVRIVRGRTEILRGVDWSVAPGEHWAILGANGWGKTTLLKALAGYMAPTSGEISLLSETKGYRFAFTPPIQVTVLDGDVKGNARSVKNIVPLAITP